MLKSIYENYLKHSVILIPESLQKKKCFVVKIAVLDRNVSLLRVPRTQLDGMLQGIQLEFNETSGHNGLSKSVVIHLLKRSRTAVFFSLHRHLSYTSALHCTQLYCELLNSGRRSAASKAKSFSFPKPLSNSHPSKIQHGPTAHSQVGDAAEQLREQG